MQIELRIDESCREPRVVIIADGMTEEVSELNAVMLQTALCGLMGSGFAMAAVIWDMDAWSLARQTGTYFTVACLLMLPIAYVANWMQHTVRGVLVYVGVFVGIFLIAWLIQLLVWKHRVRKINERIRQNGSKS